PAPDEFLHVGKAGEAQRACQANHRRFTDTRVFADLARRLKRAVVIVTEHVVGDAALPAGQFSMMAPYDTAELILTLSHVSSPLRRARRPCLGASPQKCCLACLQNFL